MAGEDLQALSDQAAGLVEVASRVARNAIAPR